jgi:hypothetical protein
MTDLYSNEFGAYSIDLDARSLAVESIPRKEGFFPVFLPFVQQFAKEFAHKIARCTARSSLAGIKRRRQLTYAVGAGINASNC